MGEPAPQLPTPRERAEAHFEEWASHLSEASGPVRLSEEADTAADALKASDPEAFEVFASGLVHEAVATRLRSHLARFRHAAVRHQRVSSLRRFHRDTVEAIEAGETPPSPYDAMYALPGSNVRVRLGDMRRGDLLAVARQRAGLARANAAESRFMAALADRVGDDETTVSEAISEHDVVALHDKAAASDLDGLPDTDTDETRSDDDA